jgi:hypothetical protein
MHWHSIHQNLPARQRRPVLIQSCQPWRQACHAQWVSQPLAMPNVMAGMHDHFIDFKHVFNIFKLHACLLTIDFLVDGLMNVISQ